MNNITFKKMLKKFGNTICLYYIDTTLSYQYFGNKYAECFVNVV